jgi:threonylcarbamoyladenosine tRNA methylthiotransferase MtaB
MFGYTDNYVKVKLPYNESLVNQVISVKIGQFDEEGLMQGELVKELHSN